MDSAGGDAEEAEDRNLLKRSFLQLEILKNFHFSTLYTFEKISTAPDYQPAVLERKLSGQIST